MLAVGVAAAAAAVLFTQGKKDRGVDEARRGRWKIAELPTARLPGGVVAVAGFVGWWSCVAWPRAVALASD